MSSASPTERSLTVRIPGLLRSYTAGAATVTLSRKDETTLDDVLYDLDRRYPGLRFRIVDEQQCLRTHIKIFVDAMLVRELSRDLNGAREVMIVGALSGGEASPCAAHYRVGSRGGFRL